MSTTPDTVQEPPPTEQPVESSPEQAEQPAPQGGVPGTAVLGTTTLDALVTTAFSQKSSDLGALTYTWTDFNTITGVFAAATSDTGKNAACVKIRFEPRAPAPSVLKP